MKLIRFLFLVIFTVIISPDVRGQGCDVAGSWLDYSSSDSIKIVFEEDSTYHFFVGNRELNTQYFPSTDKYFKGTFSYSVNKIDSLTRDINISLEEINKVTNQIRFTFFTCDSVKMQTNKLDKDEFMDSNYFIRFKEN